MLVSLLIVATVAAFAWRGLLRGFVVELVGVAGVLVAVVSAVQVSGAVARLLPPAVPLVRDTAEAMLALALLAVGFAGTWFAARWASRQRRRLEPPPVQRVEGVGGSVFAGAWSLLLVTASLIVATGMTGISPAAAGPVCDAPLARYLLGADNPLYTAGQQLASLGRPAMRWVGWAPRQTQAMDAGDVCRRVDERRRLRSVTDQGLTFAPASVDELIVAGDVEEAVLELANEARREAGVAPLRRDRSLRAVGEAHARDMYTRGFFRHTTPECGDARAGCEDPFDRMRRAGIEYRVAGENLALAATATKAHDGLMASPTHRANLLAHEYRRVGIAVLRGPLGLMVVQEFAG